MWTQYVGKKDTALNIMAWSTARAGAFALGNGASTSEFRSNMEESFEINWNSVETIPSIISNIDIVLLNVNADNMETHITALTEAEQESISDFIKAGGAFCCLFEHTNDTGAGGLATNDSCLLKDLAGANVLDNTGSNVLATTAPVVCDRTSSVINDGPFILIADEDLELTRPWTWTTPGDVDARAEIVLTRTSSPTRTLALAYDNDDYAMGSGRILLIADTNFTFNMAVTASGQSPELTSWFKNIIHWLGEL